MLKRPWTTLPGSWLNAVFSFLVASGWCLSLDATSVIISLYESYDRCDASSVASFWPTTRDTERLEIHVGWAHFVPSSFAPVVSVITSTDGANLNFPVDCFGDHSKILRHFTPYSPKERSPMQIPQTVTIKWSRRRIGRNVTQKMDHCLVFLNNIPSIQ